VYILHVEAWLFLDKVCDARGSTACGSIAWVCQWQLDFLVSLSLGVILHWWCRGRCWGVRDGSFATNGPQV